MGLNVVIGVADEKYVPGPREEYLYVFLLPFLQSFHYVSTPLHLLSPNTQPGSSGRLVHVETKLTSRPERLEIPLSRDPSWVRRTVKSFRVVIDGLDDVVTRLDRYRLQRRVFRSLSQSIVPGPDLPCLRE